MFFFFFLISAESLNYTLNNEVFIFWRAGRKLDEGHTHTRTHTHTNTQTHKHTSRQNKMSDVNVSLNHINVPGNLVATKTDKSSKNREVGTLSAASEAPRNYIFYEKSRPFQPSLWRLASGFLWRKSGHFQLCLWRPKLGSKQAF